MASDLHAREDVPRDDDLRCAYVYTTGPQPRLVVTGEIDLDARATLRLADLDVAMDPGPSLAVDLTGVPFLDSTGIHWLLRLNDTCVARGTAMAVTIRAGGPVARALRVALGSAAPPFALDEA